MALKKIIETGYGVNAEYWNVREIIWIKNADLRVLVQGFKDSQARTEGMNPLIEVPFVLSLNLISSDNLMEDIYTELKTTTMFNGAEDC